MAPTPPGLSAAEGTLAADWLVESVREELWERAVWRGESSPVWILGDDPPLLG